MVLRGVREGIEKKFFDLCSKVVDEQGYALYDLDYFPGNQELRVFIMDRSTGSAVIEDCVKIDSALTPYIEELEWMPDQLRLEVSSPGVFRSLTSFKHFEDAQGEMVELVLKQKLTSDAIADLPKNLEGQKKVRLKLEKVFEDKLELAQDEFSLNIEFEIIKKANISPDF